MLQIQHLFHARVFYLQQWPKRRRFQLKTENFLCVLAILLGGNSVLGDRKWVSKCNFSKTAPFAFPCKLQDGNNILRMCIKRTVARV